MKSVRLSQVTGSLSDYARDGLREPVVVTRQGRPLVAVMPLGRFDDRESVALSTNRKFMEIIERSRASAREKGTVPLAEARKRLAPRRKPARRGKRRAVGGRRPASALDGRRLTAPRPRVEQTFGGVPLHPVRIGSLSNDEPLDLLERLWESLSRTPSDVPVTPAHLAELDRRSLRTRR